MRTKANEAHDWWLKDGIYYDPDTEDVDWFDKRSELAQHAFDAGLKRAAELLETSGVLLSIVPGETKAAHVKRFAEAFAAKLRSLGR